MIFVTVGSQEPFDRLIRAVDAWAKSRGRSDVLAQIARSSLRPEFVQFTQFVEPAEFTGLCAKPRSSWRTAGMGSIISAIGTGQADCSDAAARGLPRDSQRSSGRHGRALWRAGKNPRRQGRKRPAWEA